MGLTIVDLPVEILENIACRLGNTDLIALRTICRRIEQCTFRHVRDAFFDRIMVNLDDGKRHRKLQFFSENEQLKKYVQYLSIIIYETRYPTEPGRRLMDNSSNGWTHLKEFFMAHFKRVEDIGWSTKLISGATNLQRLRILDCGDMDGFINQLLAQKILPQLQKIELECLQVSITSLSQLILHFKDSLRDFIFNWIIITRTNISLPAVLMEWGETLPLLQQFRVYDCSFQTDETRLTIRFPSLHQNTEGLPFQIWTHHGPANVIYTGQSGGKALKILAAHTSPIGS